MNTALLAIESITQESAWELKKFVPIIFTLSRLTVLKT